MFIILEYIPKVCALHMCDASEPNPKVCPPQVCDILESNPKVCSVSVQLCDIL